MALNTGETTSSSSTSSRMQPPLLGPASSSVLSSNEKSCVRLVRLLCSSSYSSQNRSASCTLCRDVLQLLYDSFWCTNFSSFSCYFFLFSYLTISSLLSTFNENSLLNTCLNLCKMPGMSVCTLTTGSSISTSHFAHPRCTSKSHSNALTGEGHRTRLSPQLTTLSISPLINTIYSSICSFLLVIVRSPQFICSASTDYDSLMESQITSRSWLQYRRCCSPT